jgi:DNA-binding NarL/FixJ family response regulator
MTRPTTTAPTAKTRAGSTRTARKKTTVTARQQQIVTMLAARFTRGEIALELGVMPGTVGDYIKDLYLRLDVHDARTAVDVARRVGLIPGQGAER